MGDRTSSVPQERNASVAGQRVRFLDRDPVPPSLRGKEAQIEQVTQRSAIVWAGGIRRSVPKSWLVPSNTPASPDLVVDQGSLASGQAATAVAQPADPWPCQGSRSFAADPDAEGDDDPITEQAWYSLLEACLELNLSPEDAQQMIAEAVGVLPDELDPSRLTWRQYLQAIEQLEKLETPQLAQPALPPPPPPPVASREAAKAIYPPPSRYLGVAAYNELVAIAANLGLDEEAMVARLGIPAGCPGYLLDRPWIFAIARGLAAIAAGQQPGQPDLSKAVLKFEYRSNDSLVLVVVGPDGTLLHGDPAIVADWTKQLRIHCDSIGGSAVAGLTAHEGIPLANRNPGVLVSEVAQQPSLLDSKPCRSIGDSTYITEQDWNILEAACRKARMQPIQMMKFIAGAARIPVCRLGRTSLTREQYQEVMVQLEEYRRQGSTPSPFPAEVEDDKPITEQAWDLLQSACCDLGMEQWQAQQVIAEATGIPLSSLESSWLTEQQYMQVFGRLEELEAARIRPPLSHLPSPLTRPYPQWIDARLADKPQKKRSKRSRSTPKDEEIPHWLWDGGLDED